jgi:hypothetical protein
MLGHLFGNWRTFAGAFIQHLKSMCWDIHLEILLLGANGDKADSHKLKSLKPGEKCVFSHTYTHARVHMYTGCRVHVVSIATYHGLDDPAFNFQQAQETYSSQKRQECFWSPPNLPFNRYRQPFPSCCVGWTVKHDMRRENFTFTHAPTHLRECVCTLLHFSHSFEQILLLVALLYEVYFSNLQRQCP